MTNTRRPLRLNVGFLIGQPIGTSRDFNFDFSKIRFGEDLSLTDFHGTARLSRTPQGLLLQGEFQGALNLDCARCLEPYEHLLKWSLTELYAFDQRSVSESGLVVPEDGFIDIEPLMRDYALIEIPINPLCKQECKGLCPVCGENLNQVECGHQPESPETPFAALKSFLDE